jgi:hypothetical protein
MISNGLVEDITHLRELLIDHPKMAEEFLLCNIPRRKYLSRKSSDIYPFWFTKSLQKAKRLCVALLAGFAHVFALPSVSG